MANPIHNVAKFETSLDSQTFVSTRQESKLAISSPSRFNFTRSPFSFDLIIALTNTLLHPLKPLLTLCQPWLYSVRRPWCQDCLTSERQLVGMGFDSHQVWRAARYPGVLRVIYFHSWPLVGDMEMRLKVLSSTISVSIWDFWLLLERIIASISLILLTSSHSV